MPARQSRPPRDAGPLRAVPSLVFDVTRTVGTLTTASFGPGYNSTQVTLMSNAALELQRTVGPEQFSVLLILAMSAHEEPGGLVVDGATAVVAEQTGWGRQKCSRLLATLEDAGFLRREQKRAPSDNGKLAFAAMRTWLTPELYQTTERRLSVATTSISGVARSVDADRDTGTSLSGGAGYVDGLSVDAERDNGGVVPGRTADAISDSGRSRQHHGDEDEDEVHSVASDDDERPAARAWPDSGDDLTRMRPGLPSSLRASAAVALQAQQPAPQQLEVVEVRVMSDVQTVELLRSWRVFGAEQVVKSTPPRLLAEAIAAVTSRGPSIDNPGGYLRKLLRQASEGSLPTPAAKVAPGPAPKTARASTVTAVSPVADEREPVAVSADEIDETLRTLSPSVRLDLLERVDAELDGTAWLRGRSEPIREGFRRVQLAAHLRRLGALPSDT